MAVQSEEQFVTVAVHDGEIILKAPCFGDYLDMSLSGDDEDVEEVTAKPTATRERFLRMAEKLIARWSYEEPVTQANIAALDSKTSVVLLTALNELLGVKEETEAETKKVATA